MDSEQLRLNQVFIDLVYEYEDSVIPDYNVPWDAKGLMKFMYNRGYVLRPVGQTQ